MFDNYTNLFPDERFLQSVKVTLTYVVFGTPDEVGWRHLAIAMLLNSKRRGQGFYRSAFYVPSLIGASVSIAIVWKAMFGDAGPVDQFLSFFGIGTWRLGGKPQHDHAHDDPADCLAVRRTHDHLPGRAEAGPRGTL